MLTAAQRQSGVHRGQRQSGVHCGRAGSTGASGRAGSTAAQRQSGVHRGQRQSGVHRGQRQSGVHRGSAAEQGPPRQSGVHRGSAAERGPPRQSGVHRGQRQSGVHRGMCSSLGPIWAAGPCIRDNALRQRSSPRGRLKASLLTASLWDRGSEEAGLSLPLFQREAEGQPPHCLPLGPRQWRLASSLPRSRGRLALHSSSPTSFLAPIVGQEGGGTTHHLQSYRRGGVGVV
ncbi:unnamed protein product [Gadus morhua 'NCC']